MKRILSMLLTLSMILSLVMVMPASAASTVPAGTPGTDNAAVNFSRFTDVKGHWGESKLRWAVENGLMVGVSTTKMAPDAKITRAQVATMVTRAFGATKTADVSMYIDVKSTEWYYNAISQALQMGCLETFGNAINPNEAVTRQEVAVMLVKAAGYPLVANPDMVLSKFKDGGTTSTAYRPYFATAISNGLINGYGDGRCGPQDNITRAQFATIMKSVASAYMTKTITYSSKTVDGSLMVGLGGIKLNAMSISKNLFLTDGVESSPIVLEGTTVGGTVFVRGTGGEGLFITDGSRVGAVVFNNPNNAVKLTVDESSSVGAVYVQNGKDNVYLSGNVGDVAINTGKVPVNLVDANVKTLSVNSKLAKLSVDKDSDIKSLSLTQNAAGSTVEADGDVDKLYINAADATVNINGSLGSLDFGSSATGTKFKIGKNANLKTVKLSADDLDLGLNGKITTTEISSDDSKIEFNGDYEGTTIEVTGDDDEIILANGATVRDIYLNGDDIEVSGKGTVTKRITVEGGKRIDITLPNVEVYNKGGQDVYVGSVLVRKGQTVTSNASGTGTVADDIANGRDPNAGGSNSGGSSGGVNNGNGWTITLVPNGGSVSYRSYKTDKSGAVPSLPDATRSGYKFLGWFTTVSGGNQIVQGSVISSNTTLYAHWQVIDSGGNNPGGGDNPGTTPITPVMNLMLPVNAQPSDFGQNSAYSYATFGSGLSLDSDNKLTGTVKEIKNFAVFGEDGYYVPVILQATVVSSLGTVTVGDRSFSAGNLISSGTGYNGQIIAYLPLNPLATDKVVSVVYDADGSASTYNAVSATVNYSEVLFVGSEADNLIYSGVEAIPGIDGGETAQLSKVKNDDCDYSLALTTQNLLETRKEGRYGYWTGISLSAYSDVWYAKIKQTDPTGASTENVLYPIADDGGVKRIQWVVDASNKKLGTGDAKGIYTLEVTWYDNEDKVSSHKVGKLTIDLNGCKLAGDGTPAEGTKPCVSDIAVTIPTADEYTANYGSLTSATLADYGLNIVMNQNSVSGQLFPVDIKGDGEYKYYIPIKIVGKGAEGATGSLKVIRDSGGSLAAKEVEQQGDGSFTIYAILEMLEAGMGVSDTKITFSLNPVSTAFTDVSTIISCDAATNTKGQLVVSATVPTGTVGGQAVTSCITTSGYRVYYNNLWFNEGTTIKKLANATVYSKHYDSVWVVPVTLRTILPADADYTIKCSMSDVESDVAWTLTKEQFEAAGGSVLVPVAYGDTKSRYADLYLYQDGVEGAVGSVSFSVSSDVKLDGFTGSGSGTPVLPDPSEVTKVLDKIEVSDNPTTMTYKVGDTFSSDGMKVLATFTETIGSGESATSKQITEDITSSVVVTIGGKASAPFITVGDETVTVTYKYGEGTGVTKSATFSVKVEAATSDTPAKELKSISIKTEPNKTTYEHTNTLDLTGLVVEATFQEGDNTTTETVTGYTTDPVDGESLEYKGETSAVDHTQDVTVSYTSGEVTKTATFTITVKNPNPTEVMNPGED